MTHKSEKSQQPSRQLRRYFQSQKRHYVNYKLHRSAAPHYKNAPEPPAPSQRTPNPPGPRSPWAAPPPSYSQTKSQRRQKRLCPSAGEKGPVTKLPLSQTDSGHVPGADFSCRHGTGGKCTCGEAPDAHSIPEPSGPGILSMRMLVPHNGSQFVVAAKPECPGGGHVVFGR